MGIQRVGGRCPEDTRGWTTTPPDHLFSGMSRHTTRAAVPPPSMPVDPSMLVGMLGLVLVACQPGTRPTAASESAPLPEANHEAALLHAFDFGKRFGETRSAIRGAADTTCATDATPEPNRHGYGVDTIFRIACGGLDFVVRLSGYDGREMLETTTLTSDRYRPTPEIRIGVTTTMELLTHLGRTDDFHPADGVLDLHYRGPSIGADEYVQFALLVDTLRAVAWVFYVD